MVVFVSMVAGCSHDATRLLDRMSEAYRAAGRYSDDARVRIRYRKGDSEVDHTIPYRVAFERPDRIRVECYDAQLVSDGEKLRAAVGGVPGQVLEESVKTPLALDQLFTDPLLRSMLTEGEAGCPTQLALLLADDTVDLVLSESIGSPRVAGSETLDGHPCAKIEIDKPDGMLVLWIDEATMLLRRMALPTKAYAAFLSSQLGAVSGVEVVADFVGAAFDVPIRGDAFTFEVPPGARRVASFEPAQSPDPPSDLVGKPVPPFTLAAIGGAGVSRESLAGRIAVLEFFFDGCVPCSRSMPLVGAAVDSLREKGLAIAHHHVSLDEADVGDEAVREVAARAGGTAGILRDPRGVAAAAFDVTSFPAVVVLAPDGTVADVQRGPNDRVGEDVVEIVSAIAEGRPPRPLVEGRFERRLAEYRSTITDAAGSGVAAIPERVIVPRRQADRFNLVREWRSDVVDMPGAIVRVDPVADPAEGDVRLFVLDGWRSVVELSSEGKAVARHELAIPRDAAAGFLRTAVDSEGRRWWLSGSVGGQHLFVFDEAWKLSATYPELGGGPHAGIAAAELVDTDGDGTPEIVVGIRGTAGVHGVSLGGKRLWKERAIHGVVAMTADRPDDDGRRGVVVVDGGGRLVRVAADGVAGSPVAVEPGSSGLGAAGTLPIRSLHGAPVGVSDAMEPTWAMLAIGGASVGRNIAIGIGDDLSARWNLPLPDGLHREGPVEPVAWADLLGSRRRQWLLAAADGSVFVVWDDGGLVGRYCHGEPILGIAGYVDAGGPHVVLVTRSAVESLRMEDIALD